MHQEKDGPNCENDAVDVVSSSDDPLTELDVESCMIFFFCFINICGNMLTTKKAMNGFKNFRFVC